MRISSIVLLLLAVAMGCTTRSTARLREQNAFLAGQNAALMQHQVQNNANNPGVDIIGPVQRPHIPWVAGLTLAQAIITANYVGQEQPKQVIITRNGESAAMNASVLLNGQDIRLEIGDTIELR